MGGADRLVTPAGDGPQAIGESLRGLPSPAAPLAPRGSVTHKATCHALSLCGCISAAASTAGTAASCLGCRVCVRSQRGVQR